MKVMKTFSVSLSDPDAATFEAVVAEHVGVAPHMVHIALLRIALRCATADVSGVGGELAKIQEERRNHRQTTRKEAAAHWNGNR